MFFHRQRMEARTIVAVPAVMRFAERIEDVTVANASSKGVLVLLSSPPARGTAIELIIAGDVLKGQVRWCAAGRCGVALKQTISVADLVEGRAVPVVYVPERLARRSAMDILLGLLT